MARAPRPSLLRQHLKKLGFLAGVILLAMWVLSPRWAVATELGNMSIALEQGAIWLDYDAPDVYWRRHGVRPAPGGHLHLPGWRLQPWPVVCIPLWIPFALVSIPTAFLWWRDYRVRPELCYCGYDLTGNVSGQCPECGKEVTITP